MIQMCHLLFLSTLLISFIVHLFRALVSELRTLKLHLTPRRGSSCGTKEPRMKAHIWELHHQRSQCRTLDQHQSLVAHRWASCLALSIAAHYQQLPPSFLARILWQCQNPLLPESGQKSISVRSLHEESLKVLVYICMQGVCVVTMGTTLVHQFSSTSLLACFKIGGWKFWKWVFWEQRTYPFLIYTFFCWSSFIYMIQKKNKGRKKKIQCKWSQLALLTKAIELELPAFPNAPNIGLIITYKIRSLSNSNFENGKTVLTYSFVVLQ